MIIKSKKYKKGENKDNKEENNNNNNDIKMSEGNVINPNKSLGGDSSMLTNNSFVIISKGGKNIS